MTVSVKFSGGVQLGNLAYRLRAAGAKDVEKQMRKELSALAKPLQRDVKKGIPGYMPSGYAPILAKAFRTTVKISRGAGASVTIVGRARGAKTWRAVVALNNGLLRHPVYGRTRRTRLRGYSLNPWVAQKVKAGFWTNPADAMADDAARAAVKVLDGIAAKIVGG